MIRRARPEDAARISEVICASIRALCAADHGDDPAKIANWLANKTSADIAALIAAQGGAVYVAGRPEGRLTATATAHAFYRHHGWRADGPPRPGRWILGHPMQKRLD